MRSELERLCERHGVKAEPKWDDTYTGDDWPAGASHWKVTLRLGRKRLTVPFHQGPAHCKEPTPADVLGCLCADASSVAGNGFNNWCDDMGYDSDSRKAEQIYKACERIERRLRKFLGEHFDEFCQAEH